MGRQKDFLLLLIAGFLVLCFLMIRPYLGYILTGLILAFLFYPAKNYLDQFTGSNYSSALVIILTVLGAILPVIATVGFVAGDAASLVNSLNQSQTQSGLEIVSGIEQQVQNLTGQDISLQERIQSGLRTAGNFVVSSTSDIVSLASGVLVGLSLMLFVEFYGLKDGRRVVDWTEEFDVMPGDVQKALYRDTAETTRAVVKGHIFVAIATGLLTGIGLFAVGVPNSAFWTFIAMIAGLIPLVGTALIWVPAVVYLLLTGSVVSAVGLGLYSLVVVGGLAENFLRPYLVDEEADLHPLYILLGVVGGIGLFGVIGLFVGPIVFGVAKSLLEIYRKNLDEFS